MITYALFKKRIDEHLAVDEHWAGLDARTLGRSDARTPRRGRADACASAHLGAI